MRWKVLRMFGREPHPVELTGTPDLVEDQMQALATDNELGELTYKYFRKHSSWEIHTFFRGRNGRKMVHMKIREVTQCHANDR